ncbi:MAG: NUDIX domain-containing protein [Defluviicoccus sp.]|nr:NUDIX domain-containing protein [Defluviicoccus sp.]MDE0274924.1 NUDIX domain-containing protein [Defluviicoccus sp.]
MTARRGSVSMPVALSVARASKPVKLTRPGVLKSAEADMHRIGIIPFDMRGEAIALLFVTSQTRGRWILPKGSQKPDETHVETCCREGFEEAGVRGSVLEDYPFTVTITKQTERGKDLVPVTYYPFLVTEQIDEWPEMEKRQRHWALIEDSARVAYSEDYLFLIHQFERLKPWIRESAVARRS